MDGPPGASIVASENDSNLQADSDGQQDNSAQEASDIQGDIDEPTSVLSQSNLDHLERDTLESRARKQIEQALISLRKGSTIFNSRETSALIQAGQDWIERKDQPRAIPQSYQLPSRPPPPSSSPPRPHPPGPPPFRQKKKYGPDTLDCNIQRASMSTWSWAVKIKSHVLQVFYRGNAPIEFPGASTTDDDFKKAYDNSHGLEKPVRVKINSALLVKELENIAGQELDIRSESYLM
ncbi:hypothetical protein F5Y16DRAFT_105809 [Xylariaceae sp. FL0255]|nr:hypothetical protein F5Y16DRAFT_105809 [Xylariaceae sp. FL0255]